MPWIRKGFKFRNFTYIFVYRRYTQLLFYIQFWVVFRSSGPEAELSFSDRKVSVCMSRPYVINFSHFQLLQNHITPSDQTYHNCSSSDPEEVWHLNPRWLFLFLVGWDIFDIFSRTTASEVCRFARNFPLHVPKKCCCFSEQFKIQYDCSGLWLADIFLTLFSKTTSFEVTRLAIPVPLGVLKNWC